MSEMCLILLYRMTHDLLPFTLYGIGSLCFLAGTVLVIVREVFP